MSKKGLAVAGVLALVAATPPARNFGRAILFLSEILPSPISPLDKLTREPYIEDLRLEHGDATLYVPHSRKGRGIVLVHGANPGGAGDDRVVTTASALARLGRVTIVPKLALGERRLDRNDTTLIRDAIAEISQRVDGKVVVLAFSFGAAFTFVALEEEPAIQERVELVASIGTYYDMAHLVQGITTGRVDAGEEEPVRWTAGEGAPALLAIALSQSLEQSDRDAFIHAFTTGKPDGLSPEALSIYELMSNRDPAKTKELILGLPAGLPQLFLDLSPSQAPETIHIPVHVLHSIEDPAAPPSESILLIKKVASSERCTFTPVGSLKHVTPTGTPLRWAGDATSLVGFTMRIFD